MSSTSVQQGEGNDELQILQQQDYIYQRKTDNDFVAEKQVSVTSLLLEFIKQLRPGMEVYRIAVPAILIRPVSLLENLANSCNPNQYLLNAQKENSPGKRMLSVVKWALCTQLVVPQKGFVGLKPFNPILGEVFRCHWDHEDGSVTYFIGEQVSHHPPVTAFIMYNPVHNVAYTVHFDPHTSFYGNYASTSLKSGRFCVYLFDHMEEYEIVNPPVLVKGFLWGTSCAESIGEMKITCARTGHTALIDFKSGNKVEGKILNKAEPIYKIKGNFDGTVELIHLLNEHKKERFYNTADVPNMALTKKVRPVYEQDLNESRRVWHKAAFSVLYKEFQQANVYKNEVEERQRQKAKLMKDKVIPEYKPVYFYPKKAQAASDDNSAIAKNSRQGKDEENRYEWTFKKFTPERAYQQMTNTKDTPEQRSWLLSDDDEAKAYHEKHQHLHHTTPIALHQYNTSSQTGSVQGQ